MEVPTRAKNLGTGGEKAEHGAPPLRVAGRAFLWPVALLNYLDRQMLAAMKYSVMADVPTIGSEANWGFMLGQFKWVYAFLSPIGGYVADRFSRRLTICGSLFVWSGVTWWTGRPRPMTNCSRPGRSWASARRSTSPRPWP